MSESALSLPWASHRRLIGAELGYGPDPDNYNTNQNLMVDDCLDRGIRQFYSPPPIDKNGISHQWSFMRPIVQLTTVADQWGYDLPAEFGGICGDVTFVTTTTTYNSIRLINDQQIRRLRETQPATTGTPSYVAVRWLAHDGSVGQKQQLVFNPTPNAVFTLEYQMLVNPAALSKQAPWPYGGMKHAETILASCLEIAEHSPDGGGNGSRHAKWMERLATSISQDCQDNVADNIGYMGDPSVGVTMRGRRSRRSDFVVSYNGVEY